MQVNSLVFDQTPQTLDKDIISPSTASVHTEPAVLIFHRLRKCLGRELAALVGIDDFRPPILPKCLFWHIYGMTGF